MLAYVTLGTNDKDKALAFYDAFMPALGAKRLFDNERLYFYGTGQGAPMLAIGGTYDGETATCGNGVMPALACPDRESVDKAYQAALDAGAIDDGPPGERVPGFFYGAYFRDPDGHKICVCKIG
jgi:catechol 2,3-dioxygenase-like lactoylglutathione lyase family enzyme